MKTPRLLLLAPLALLALLPSERAVAKTTAVDEIHIAKSAHKLELKSNGAVVKSYKVALGSGGTGAKQFEGDAKTPVGTYHVVGRIPGLFHEFLTVSYPNDEDRKRFAELKKEGKVPAGKGVGFGIGIHGTGVKEWNGKHKEHDWTLGCIALDDEEIDEVAKLVKDGTKIVIDE